jgi:hypothetical protein
MIDSDSNSSIHYLSSINHHERDQCITFDEDPHIYTIQGDLESDYTSVTTWNHRHFEEFDSDKIIDNMMKSKNWKTNKYYGMTKEEIITLWDASRNEAVQAGTKLHYDIECYYNNCNSCSSSSTSPIQNSSLEYSYFLKFAEDYKHLKPYRTEWMIWDSDVKIAGSVDMVFQDDASSDPNADPDSILIYDWKRCKDITKTSNFNKYATTECINHLPDTNFWHYSLQLNVYKYILERNYSKKVKGLYLVCLHPSNKNGSYIRIPCVDLQKEVEDLFDMRKRELEADGMKYKYNV